MSGCLKHPEALGGDRVMIRFFCHAALICLALVLQGCAAQGKLELAKTADSTALKDKQVGVLVISAGTNVTTIFGQEIPAALTLMEYKPAQAAVSPHAGPKKTEAIALDNLGLIEFALGNYAAALETTESALTIAAL